MEAHASPHAVEVPSRVPAALALWLLGALAFAASGAVAHLPRPAVPLLIWGPVVGLALAYRRGGAVREFARGVSLRWPVLWHLVRVYFGAAFLVEMEAGRMPAAFALVAGPGDIVAGLAAVPAAWCATRDDSASRRLVLAWNVLGLVDILAVFLTAQRLIFFVGDARLFEAFQRFPYGALPVFVVPMVIATHLLVFARLRDGGR